MKYRISFVTNSSSSSFIVQKKNLTDLQLHQIRNHLKIARENNWDKSYGYKIRDYDAWDIVEDDDTIILDTIVDNFDMEEFLRNINVSDTEYKQH